jgi:hypothetical protein
LRKLFGEYYDKEVGLLNFGDDYQPLKGEVAPITEEMRITNPKIDFFERKIQLGRLVQNYRVSVD